MNFSVLLSVVSSVLALFLFAFGVVSLVQKEYGVGVFLVIAAVVIALLVQIERNTR